MKKQIISLLALMVSFAPTTFAEDVVDEQLTVLEDAVESVKDSSLQAVKDSAKQVVKVAEDSLATSLEEVVDSVAADTSEPYVPYSEGLLLRPEVGGGKLLFSDRVDTKPNFDITAGVNLAYQLNANLSIGWGISFYMSSMKMEDFDEIMDWNPTLRDEYEDKVYRLPIYIMGRWKFTPRKVTPFVDARLGYAVGLNKYSFKPEATNPGISTDNSGLFLELGLGIHYKCFSVAVVLDRLGCKDEDPDFRELNGWPGIKTSYHDTYVGLKFGFDITFGNGEEEPEEAEEGSESTSKQ